MRFFTTLAAQKHRYYATMARPRDAYRKRIPTPAQMAATAQAQQHYSLQDNTQHPAAGRNKAYQQYLRGSLLHPQRPICMAARARSNVQARAPATSPTGKGYSQHSPRNKKHEPRANSSPQRGDKRNEGEVGFVIWKCEGERTIRQGCKRLVLHRMPSSTLRRAGSLLSYRPNTKA